MTQPPMTPWTILARRSLFDGERTSIEIQTVRLPGGRVVDDYWRVTTGDFACCFVRDEAGLVICERQYKHGPGREVLTLPAGGLLAGETGLEAARRELLEETGYAAETWQPLGQYTLSGNQRVCLCHAFRAERARPVAAPRSGDLEEMEIVLLDDDALRAALAEGRFGVVSDMGIVALALALGH